MSRFQEIIIFCSLPPHRFHSAMTENILQQEEPIEISAVNEVHELPDTIDLKPTDEGFSDGESAADSQEVSTASSFNQRDQNIRKTSGKDGMV